jgi:hypothetical protein
MRLVGDGTVVVLEPVSYQFPSRTDGEVANWVVIAGTVTSPGGSWSFREAVLETFEAKTISLWLRSVAQGAVEVVSPDEQGFLSPTLTFTEPDLAFSVAGRTHDTVEVRVHLSHGFAPTWLDIDERLNMWQFFVTVPMQSTGLVEAADAWDEDWRSFPERP